MPDKHEVGGSSPLGPTNEAKETIKVQRRAKRPRAFVERVEQLKSAAKRSVRDDEFLRKQKAVVRHKHRHGVDFVPKILFWLRNHASGKCSLKTE